MENWRFLTARRHSRCDIRRFEERRRCPSPRPQRRRLPPPSVSALTGNRRPTGTVPISQTSLFQMQSTRWVPHDHRLTSPPPAASAVPPPPPDRSASSAWYPVPCPTLTTALRGFERWTVPCDFALTRSSPATEKTTVTGLTPGTISSLLRWSGTQRSRHMCTLGKSQRQLNLHLRNFRLPDLRFDLTTTTAVALTGSKSFRGTLDRREVLTIARWQVTSMSLGMWPACRKGPASSPMVPWRRTFTWAPSTTALSPQQGHLWQWPHVHADSSSLHAQVFFLGWARSSPANFASLLTRHVSTSQFQMCTSITCLQKKAIRGRAPDPSCSYFTVANVHFNSECAKRRSVCIALLLLVRDLCLKLDEVVLTDDFNKGAVRELFLEALMTSAASHRLKLAHIFDVTSLNLIILPHPNAITLALSFRLNSLTSLHPSSFMSTSLSHVYLH